MDSIVCLKRHWPRKIDLKLGCCPKFIKVRSLLSALWPHFRHKTGSPNDRHQLPVLNIAPVRKFMTKLSRSGQWFHKKYGHLVNRLLIQSIKARLERVCDMSNTAIRFSDYLLGTLLWQLTQYYQRRRTVSTRKQCSSKSITYPICFHLLTNKRAGSEVRFYDIPYLASVMSCL